MPPRLRAQGPPSSPPQLPATLPVRHQGTRAPSEAIPEPVKRKRKLSQRAKANQDAERHKVTDPPAPANIQGRATKQQRQDYSAHLAAKADAAQRVRDLDQQEQARFDAEVAEHGMDGALRRRMEEIEARRVQQMATTSEVDEME